LEVTAPAVAVKVAVVAAAGTRTEAGTVNAVVRLLANATADPPAGAALDSVTVHVVEVEAPRVVLPQVRVLTDIPAVTEIASDLVVPFRVAVTVEL
jgi:hypothetical protein